MLEIDFLRYYFPNILGVLKSDFGGFGRRKDDLLAKTMPGIEHQLLTAQDGQT